MTELGTTFIKLGQMLSTRTDLIDPAVAEELSVLQARAPADPPETVRQTIEAELGRPPAELFSTFGEEALALAAELAAKAVAPDPDASYEAVHEIDISGLQHNDALHIGDLDLPDAELLPRFALGWSAAALMLAVGMTIAVLVRDEPGDP